MPHGHKAQRFRLSVYVSDPDGSNATRLLEYARNNSWSADGKWILSRWRPPNEPGGLVLVSTTGGRTYVAVPEDQSCPDRDKPCDLDWGQPKP
jgi:Tol biopolymer transport system component